MSHFPEPAHSCIKLRVELDLSSYATRPDSKNATCVDTSDFAKKGWTS